MRVTDKQIPMDTLFINKLDQFIKRCTQKKPALDSFIIMDGEEGYGKTTFSISTGYYISYKTGRKFNEDNLFFNVEDLTKFAKNTKEQIIIWDEGALGGLSNEWFNKSQINLIKLLMTARKHRHFFIFNIPKFYKFKDYLIDRCMGIVHTYARNDTEVGRFVYYNKKNKNKLALLFMDKNKRDYKKYVSFRGTFPDVLDKNKPYNILDVFNEEKYQANKDKAISMIGEEEQGFSRHKIAYLKMWHALSLLSKHLKDTQGLSYTKIEKICYIEPSQIARGLKVMEKYPEIFEDTRFKTQIQTEIVTNRGIEIE